MSISIRCSVAVALSVYLAPSVCLAQSAAAAPAPHSHDHDHNKLEEIIVTANPLGRTSDDLAQSATVLRGEALRQQLSNSLGETLARMPGLANASFGENVGRPVIRGLQGPRVGILSNSMAVNDASSLSQDHAVSVEPFLADQIEVLRGPSTLLYGSGAIGGVVNMVSPTIPQSIPENGYSGRVTTQGNTAADEEFAAGRRICTRKMRTMAMSTMNMAMNMAKKAETAVRSPTASLKTMAGPRAAAGLESSG
jgi:iron complex outermembrane recepter protein